MGLQSGHHTRYELKNHFVWCPKYRRLVLGGNRGLYLRRMIKEISERYVFEIVEFAV